ncbi:acyl-CoA synthetase [Caulobacter sp. 17J80-11]|uniref:acyl-CoA synthetase n=1 Tax=Caulobacter sp. 17J80-11 TaxID=2763502 RepID=UPI001CA408E5
MLWTPKERAVSGLNDVTAIEAAGMPRDLPASTYEMIGRTARQRPHAKALSFFLSVDGHARPESWSYRRFFRRITQTANLFHSLGVGKNDVVAYVLPNLPETHFTIWGAEAAGIAFAINPMLGAETIAELLNAAEAKVLVTLAPFPHTDLYEKLQGVVAQVPSLRHVVLVNLADRVRGIKNLPARWLQRREAKRHKPMTGVGVHDFGKAVDAQPNDRLVSGRSISPGDFSSYFGTGGTTGTPKIAMRRHANEVANAWMAGRWLGQGLGPKTTIFSGLPLFHVNAVTVSGLAPFARGAHVLVGTPQGYRAEGLIQHFWDIVDRHRVTLFNGVPTLFAALLQVPIGSRDVSSLEFALCGAAPMPVEVFKTFQERTGLKILEGYGMTESTCVSSVNPPLGDRRVGSIGLHLPFQQMKIVIVDDAGKYVRDAAVDEIGVVALAGPNMFAGYRTEAHNQNIWLELGDGQRWFNSGDLGRQDADGYFWLTGRKKELIIRGGHNIDPASIEDPLHRHPSVELAAAVGRPDPHSGEVPIAYVQLRPGLHATEAELLAFAHAEIGERAAQPRAVRIIPEMPLTAVGKLFKPKLRWMEVESALTDALATAGVKAVVVAAEDKQRGTLATVTLADPAQAATAREVLGRFAVASEITG